MKTSTRLILLALVAVAVFGAMVLKRWKAADAPSPTEPVAAAAQPEEKGPSNAATPNASRRQVPRLVDLGAGKCIPCKMMAPILEELKKEYAGRMEVEFIDVWANPGAGEKYGIKMIPTQIFYDSAGKELFRHEGFYSKEDILAKWKELGVDLGSERPSAG